TAFATGVAVPVEGAPVKRGTFVLWVNAEGQATALRRAPLHAQVAGPVIEVPVREGDMVPAGAVIARIDPAEYELARKEAQGALEQAEASYQDLTLGDDAIVDPDLLEARQAQARIRSGLAGAEARLEQAVYNVEKTLIRAPYAGRVANLVVDVGTRLSANDSVAAIVDLSSVDVDVQVLESEIATLDVGREATVNFTAFPGEEFRAAVVTVNPVVDPVTHVGRATVRLRNPGARILPGMHANVRIAGRLFEDRISVPKEAIVERSRREVVFVFEPDSEGSSTGRAKWRYVTTGLENEDAVEVVPSEDTDMLEEGEIVLVGGHTTLTHDALVRLSEPEEESGGAS
ncbi:MAG: efflux RND transporter periplasmic adaptor subunit, partial [Candidatus Palauibacterales bacterium]|nr:efflux RND transporter periplasmic adaptor subunit [Candidatus Palauibacterales bacterium]